MNRKIYKKLQEFGKVKLNEPLSKHTTFKIGGEAVFFISVDNNEKLAGLLKYLDDEGIGRFILGGGSNILFSDEGFEGVVIWVHSSEFVVYQDLLEVDAGLSLVKIAQESIAANLQGLEWAVGIPGSVGGAVRGNAGCMGIEIKDFVMKVQVYQDGEVTEFNNEECQFGYRDSVFKHNGGVILKVWLKLKKVDETSKKEMMAKALKNLNYRVCTQPKGYGSAGCVFKNYLVDKSEQERIKKLTDDKKILETMEKYNKVPIGRLVELVDMKGAKKGGAMVSEEHGNFIVNLGDAKASDVLFLVEEVKEKVYNKFGVKLEEEIFVVQGS
ncbi:MAG: UDP-N-acetylenolpyruvoylglucosamine reductase [Candidatus Magasanikbacteria bacterium CG_4_10_14_0_2_um_filter_37_12]|uniref:UDP-N-acetylenolpyruvoylglucosamine reductase n=1 Tax=Candidatus Magasanikbacteria bacterium CG_4_10_14_0_2_um_filter_37_12 TaxID=1974637 RepID=A0A2M7V900_9BACT|nr:MAG: UDP-N-acetylenolpyruvoylglucosamine reductase [Candidatus Magasanikbacteria bacterium CG_4_10_14_0_2_um_filter_37_12]